MLTKDLTRCRTLRGKLRPTFVSPETPELLALADQLLCAYRQERPTRADIAEAVEPVIGAFSNRRIAKGLDKLLQDRSEFRHPADLDYPDLRKKLFAESARRLRADAEADPASFRREVIAACDSLPAEFVTDGIYADLPENEELTAFRDLSARALLERYNVALVQSLLLRAEHLEVRLEAPPPARMRQLVRRLKFFRLLARVVPDEHAPQAAAAGFRLVIDGPASLFEQSKKYGLQLASFFPAICAFEHWQLDAAVAWRDKTLPLTLDETSGLTCPYRQVGTYVPEEVAMFRSHFEATVEDWRVRESAAFLDAGDQDLVFPDMTFVNDSGSTVHLELFHRWHATQLVARLDWLDEHTDVPLVIGVDRAVARKPEIAERLARSTWFEQRGFLFRDYPTVTAVRKCLGNVDAATTDDLPFRAGRCQGGAGSE